MVRIARRRPNTARERLDVDERRAQLVALGLELFSRRSYDEVSIDELARAGGVSKGLLYHYFPTKRDLYVAALRHAGERLLAETDTAAGPADEPPAARLRRGLATYLDFVEQHGGAYTALIRGGLGADPGIVAVLDETRNGFVERILADLPRGRGRPLVRLAVRGWIGFVEAAVLDWQAHRRVARNELLTLLTATLFDIVARAGGEIG